MEKFKFFKCIFIAFLFVCVGGVFAIGNDGMTDNDMDVIKDYVASDAGYRNSQLISESKDNLSIGGKVKLSWERVSEKNNKGTKMLGSGTNAPNDQLVVEGNLFVDYHHDKAGMVTHLFLKNRGGLEKACTSKICEPPNGCYFKNGSGTSDTIEVRRAYVWYRFIEEEDRLFEIDIGRQRLQDLFTSAVQFDNRINGLGVRWKDLLENITSYYINLGATIVNTQNDHFAYIGEFGAREIANTKFYTVYTFTHWRKRGLGDCGSEDVITKKRARDDQSYRLVISQFILGYKYTCPILRVLVDLSAGFLYNHAAKDYISQTAKKHDRKFNKGWYILLRFGQLVKKGDWALRFDYQYVERQVVPNFDLAGMGIKTFILGDQGRQNYRGFAIESGYQVTDNLSTTLGFCCTRSATSIDGKDSGVSGDGASEKNRRRSVKFSVIYEF